MNAHLPIAAEDAKAGRSNLNLALQGTGAHGAFGWGVLDKLLEDGHTRIEGIAATGAGAMNAVVYAFGQMKDGRDGARALLEQFWKKTSTRSTWLNPMHRTPMSIFAEPLARRWLEETAQFLSPYEFNPLNFSPMRAVLEETVDFGLLHRYDDVKLALAATHVRSGKARIFTNRELNADAVLAASCLPTLSQAVEIDGEHYWDGTYSGQSGLDALMAETTARDVLVAEIAPVERRDIPRRANDIQNRMTELAISGSLLREARTLGSASCGIDPSWLLPEHRHRVAPIRVHAIRSDAVISDLALASKFDASWPLLLKLRDAGRLSAEMWLGAQFGSVGHRSSLESIAPNHRRSS
jgi:NTE family protein